MVNTLSDLTTRIYALEQWRCVTCLFPTPAPPTGMIVARVEDQHQPPCALQPREKYKAFLTKILRKSDERITFFDHNEYNKSS